MQHTGDSAVVTAGLRGDRPEPKKTICDLTERKELISLLKAEHGVVAAQILNARDPSSAGV